MILELIEYSIQVIQKIYDISMIFANSVTYIYYIYIYLYIYIIYIYTNVYIIIIYIQLEFQFLCTGTNNTLLNILNQSNYYHIKTRAYICMHVCIYVCMYVYMCVWIYIYIYICVCYI